MSDSPARQMMVNAVTLRAAFDRSGGNVDEFIKYIAGMIAGYQEAAQENRRMLMDLFTAANHNNNKPDFVS